MGSREGSSHLTPRSRHKRKACSNRSSTTSQELLVEINKMQQGLKKTAEHVFQQRLWVHGKDRGIGLLDDAESALQKPDLSDQTRRELKILIDLEDALAKRVEQRIRTTNIVALRYLNEKRYTYALKLLLDVESMTKKDAGTSFRFTSDLFPRTPAESHCSDASLDFSPLPKAVEGRPSGGTTLLHSICVPFFTKRSERTRLTALAVIENNMGLYHFKIAEYDLAVRRLTNALEVEQMLDVETMGVTYFNLAQAQYGLGRVDSALSLITIAEDFIEKRVCDRHIQGTWLGSMLNCNGKEIGNHGDIVGGKLGETYLKWRGEVFLLAHALDIHAMWLTNAEAYRAAINRFEQCERWLSSVAKLTESEEKWREGVRKRLQKCKQLHKQNACDSLLQPSRVLRRKPSFSQKESVVVTTTLPNNAVDIADSSSSAWIINAEPDFMYKNTQDSHGAGVGDARFRAYNPRQRMRRAPRASSSQLRHGKPPVLPTNPPWDSDTVFVHDDDDGNGVTGTPAILRTFSAYETNRTKTNRGRRATLSTGDGRKFGRLGNRRQATPQTYYVGGPRGQRQFASEHGGRLQKNGEGTPVPSVMMCVRVLQAFSRAKQSMLITQWKSFLHRISSLRCICCGEFCGLPQASRPQTCDARRCIHDTAVCPPSVNDCSHLGETHGRRNDPIRCEHCVLPGSPASRHSKQRPHEVSAQSRRRNNALESAFGHSDPLAPHCGCCGAERSCAQDEHLGRHHGVSHGCGLPIPPRKGSYRTPIPPGGGIMFCHDPAISVSAASRRCGIPSAGGLSCDSPPPCWDSEKYDVIPCSSSDEHAMASETSSIRDRHASAVQHHTIFRDPMRCSSQDNGSREVYASSYTGRQAVTGEMLTIPSTSWSPGAKLLPAHPVRSTDDSPSFPASPAPELLTTLNSNSHGERLHSTGSLLRNLTLREKSALIVQLAWKKWKAHRREAAERAIVNRK